MIKIILVFFFFICLFSCNSERKKETNVNIPKKEIQIPLESVEEVEKRIGRKVNVQEYVLSQNSEEFFERVSTVPVFGRTKGGKMFKGPVMWFKNYYDENLSETGTFQDFLVDILTNPQEEALVNRIVNDFEIFNKSPEVFQNVDKSITYIIDLFTYKRENDENLYLKRKMVTPLGLKFSIAYLFYINGYVLIEDDYEPSSSFIPIDKLY